MKDGSVQVYGRLRRQGKEMWPLTGIDFWLPASLVVCHGHSVRGCIQTRAVVCAPGHNLDSVSLV